MSYDWYETQNILQSVIYIYISHISVQNNHYTILEIFITYFVVECPNNNIMQ